MTCLFPVTAYWSRELTRNGKRKLVSKKQDAHSPAPIRRPCGNCIPCRIDEARQWATRCTHEHMMHKQQATGSFLTITYDDDNLPRGNSLDRDALVRFMKRLRKKMEKHEKRHKIPVRPIRFFACGEYGDTTLRPHYHVLLLSHDIPQRKLWKRTPAGHDLYRSQWLQEVWEMGNIDIGTVTTQTIRYATQYVLKKVTGEPAAEYYGGREPEFITMSRNPGLGHAFYMKHAHQLYAHDYCIIDGKQTPLPEYYDRMYFRLDAMGLAEIKKQRRRKSMLENRADKTHARRRTRELVILKRQANFKRNQQ